MHVVVRQRRKEMKEVALHCIALVFFASLLGSEKRRGQIPRRTNARVCNARTG